jgi:hypothetical protein
VARGAARGGAVPDASASTDTAANEPAQEVVTPRLEPPAVALVLGKLDESAALQLGRDYGWNRTLDDFTT